jgi:hypothetical protein
MEFKYDIGFIVPKYGEIVGRKKLPIGRPDYEVKLNYSETTNETTNIFTEELIDEYVEKYKNVKNQPVQFKDLEKERLLKLLEYSQEAIDYWFNLTDAEQSLLDENEHFKEEVKYFIEKLSK